MQTFQTTGSIKDHDQSHFVHPGTFQAYCGYRDVADSRNTKRIVLSPYSTRTHFLPSLTNAILATAMFRCWHLILFFSGWAACVALVCRFAHDISFQSTLLNIFGTVLGFVISYRTSSSFERYVRKSCW